MFARFISHLTGCWHNVPWVHAPDPLSAPYFDTVTLSELLPLLTLSGSRDRKKSNLFGMPQSKRVKRHAERTVLSLVLGDATALGALLHLLSAKYSSQIG